MGLVSLERALREIPHLSALWKYSEKTAIYEPGSGPDTKSVYMLIVDFLAPELEKKMFAV